MKSLNVLVKSTGILVMAFFSFSCGRGGGSLVTRFDYSINESQAAIEFELDDRFALNMGASMPIRDYGQFLIEPATDESGIRVQIVVDTDILNQSDIINLDRVSDLPNGYRLPSYVKTDLAKLQGPIVDSVRPAVYLGLEPNYFYLGGSMELGFVGSDFPPGLSLSQLVQTGDGYTLGILLFYGPRLDKSGQVEVPGGLFFVANLSVLATMNQPAGSYPSSEVANRENDEKALKEGKVIIPTEVEVTDEEYDNSSAQYKLFRKFKKAAKKADAWVD